MASVFWEAKGIVFIDYLQWRILTCQLAEAAAKGNQVKMPWKTNEGVLFHQDNAPTHNSVVSIAAVHACGFELVDHSPFSPDFAI